MTRIESDADRMGRSLIEVLEVSDLVDLYTSISIDYPPKIIHFQDFLLGS